MNIASVKGYFDDDSIVQNLTSTQKYALNKVQSFFLEAAQGRENHENRMRKNERLYLNQVAKNDMTQSDVQHALVLSAIETMKPIISDYYPDINFIGRTKNDSLFQSYISKRYKDLAARSGFRDKALSQCTNALIYQNGYIKILPILVFRKDAPENVEEMDPVDQLDYKTLVGLDVSVVDPFTVFQDPVGTGIDVGNDCRYFIIAEPVPRAVVAEMYDLDESDIPTMAFNWTDYKAFSGDENQNIQGVETSDFTIMTTCYWSCAVSEDGKYRNGRKTVICGPVLLEDEEVQQSQIPYFVQKNYKSDLMAYGISEAELNASTVFTVNSFTSYMIDNLATFGKPLEVISESLNARLESDISGDDTRIVTKSPQDDYRRVTNEPVPSGMFKFMDVMMMFYDKTSGINDSLEGRRPAGIRSAQGLEALREASQVRVRHKIKHDITPMLKKAGRYIVEMITKYDTEKIDIRDGAVTDVGYTYSTIDPTVVYQKSTGKLLKEEHARGLSDDDKVVLSDTDMDIIVEVGRGYQEGSIAREMQAKEYYQEGIYPFEMYVATMQVEDKPALIRFHNERNYVLQTMMQLKTIAESMAKDIRRTEDWVQSKEFKQIQQIMNDLAEKDVKLLQETRF